MPSRCNSFSPMPSGTRLEIPSCVLTVTGSSPVGPNPLRFPSALDSCAPEPSPESAPPGRRLTAGRPSWLRGPRARGAPRAGLCGRRPWPHVSDLSPAASPEAPDQPVEPAPPVLSAAAGSEPSGASALPGPSPALPRGGCAPRRGPAGPHRALRRPRGRAAPG